MCDMPRCCPWRLSLPAVKPGITPSQQLLEPQTRHAQSSLQICTPAAATRLSKRAVAKWVHSVTNQGVASGVLVFQQNIQVPSNLCSWLSCEQGMLRPADQDTCDVPQRVLCCHCRSIWVPFWQLRWAYTASCVVLECELVLRLIRLHMQHACQKRLSSMCKELCTMHADAGAEIAH